MGATVGQAEHRMGMGDAGVLLLEAAGIFTNEIKQRPAGGHDVHQGFAHMDALRLRDAGHRLGHVRLIAEIGSAG